MGRVSIALRLLCLGPKAFKHVLDVGLHQGANHGTLRRGSKSGDLVGRHTAEVGHDHAALRWEHRHSHGGT